MGLWYKQFVAVLLNPTRTRELVRSCIDTVVLTGTNNALKLQSFFYSKDCLHQQTNTNANAKCFINVSDEREYMSFKKICSDNLSSYWVPPCVGLPVPVFGGCIISV